MVESVSFLMFVFISQKFHFMATLQEDRHLPATCYYYHVGPPPPPPEPEAQKILRRPEPLYTRGAISSVRRRYCATRGPKVLKQQRGGPRWENVSVCREALSSEE